MSKCECYKCGKRLGYYYDFYGNPYEGMLIYNYCSGTKEQEECSCKGDKTKCDFYPEVRQKALYELKEIRTNADRIRHMTDEELADYLIKLTEIIRTCDICEPTFLENGSCNCECEIGVLKWLQTEIKLRTVIR